MKGRKPLPTAVKEAQGTLRKDRMIPNEANFALPTAMPKPPATINADGKRLWNSLGAILLEKGLFTDADHVAMELLCQSYGQMIAARRQVNREGSILETDKGYKYINPSMAIVNTSWTQVQKMLAEFGLTPAERSRVMARTADDKDPTRKKLAEILFEGVEGVNGN